MLFLFRWPWRATRFFWALIPWQLIVLTLPIIAIPFITGVADGVFYYLDESVRYETSALLYALGVQSADSMDWFSVPGAPGIHDTPLPPYYIPHLRDPRNWWEKLGLVRFDVGPDGPESYLHLAELNALYRRAAPAAGGKGEGEGEGESHEWHHWVFASAQSLHMESMFLDGWDEAFDQLLRHHNAQPAAHNAAFSYITCPTHVLCNQWRVDGPALIHFTTDPEVLPAHRLKMSKVEKPAFPGYTPVAARIFPLPRLRSGDVDPLRVTFPSQFEQMRRLTSRPDAWLVEPPQDPDILHGRLVERNRHEMMVAHPVTIALFAANKLSSMFCEVIDFAFLVDMGLEPSRWAASASVVGFLAGMAGTLTSSLAAALFRELAGAGKDGDGAAAAAAGESRGEPESGGKEPKLEANFMAQMLRSTLDINLPGNDTENANGTSIEQIMKSSREGSELLERMWDIVHNGPPKDADGADEGTGEGGGKGGGNKGSSEGDDVRGDEDETGDLAFSVLI